MNKAQEYIKKQDQIRTQFTNGTSWETIKSAIRDAHYYIDETIAYNVVYEDPNNIKNLHPNLINSEIACHALSHDIHLIEFIPYIYQDQEHADQALATDMQLINYIDPQYLTPEIIEKCLATNPQSFRYVPHEYQNFEMVQNAINEVPALIEFANPDCLDTDNVRDAIRIDPNYIIHCPEKLITKRVLMELAADQKFDTRKLQPESREQLLHLYMKAYKEQLSIEHRWQTHVSQRINNYKKRTTQMAKFKEEVITIPTEEGDGEVRKTGVGEWYIALPYTELKYYGTKPQAVALAKKMVIEHEELEKKLRKTN